MVQEEEAKWESLGWAYTQVLLVDVLSCIYYCSEQHTQAEG
jgi:hypothetical protein